ncbi:MAG: hypothetical protein II362_01715, partial [Alistipes sp.]|nr:hypothetical protein [Alistipes sp.]
IFSDLYAFEEREAALMAEEPVLFDEAEFAVDLEAVTEQIEADTMPHEVQITYEWLLADEPQPRTPIAIDTRRFASGFTPIEDFSDEGRFAAFCDTLLFADRTVRVAVLGDSFIEGDILTADLRERLQAAFGGRGTGFAPMASPLTAYRRTVKTQSKGWTSHNVMQHKSVPQPFNEQFFVSGWVCRPSEGASTRWEMTDYRQRLDSCSTGRVLFVAPEESHLTLTLNDSLRQEFVVEGAAAVRQAVVRAPEIRSLEVKVSGGVKTFVGYGALFESQGVAVDNYSVRSNNGQAIFRTNPTINAQVNALVPYDLVILQYGLNIMQAGVYKYTSYGAQIEKVIAYCRECFPSAAILVLGVSDRSVKGDNGFETMDAIPYMIDCQRTAARNQGAAFWSTFDAMQAEGGMKEFVAKGWAGKDYTHINYGGGRRVAWALFDAINAEAAKADERLRRQREVAQPILDSLLRQTLEEGMQPVAPALTEVLPLETNR